MRATLAAVIGVCAAACRPPPPKASWIEEEHLGQTHVRRAPERTVEAADAPAAAPEPAPDGGAAADAAPVDRRRIAVLLPLSGRYGPLGRELKVAIELAPADGAERVYLDTLGEPAGATAAVERAAAIGAVAILGPVGVREAEAATARARELHIPVALLAPGGTADGTTVFRLVETTATEARAAAIVAAALGTPTAGVLAPNDEVGLAASQAFADAAAAAGITVTARGTYDPAAKSLEADVKAFLGLDPTTNPRLAAHLRRRGKRGWQTFSPDVPFALLYLPDRHDRAAIVASFFPYLGVELRTADFLDPDYLRRKHGGRIPQVVQLLGSSGWNHPSLAIRGGPAVEGAYFVEPCPGVLGDPAGAELHTALESRLGRAPTSVAQQAHDAWILVARARATAAAAAAAPGGAAIRTAFARALRTAALDDGACAPAAMGADGQLVREPVLLGVDAGELTAVPY